MWRARMFSEELVTASHYNLPRSSCINPKRDGPEKIKSDGVRGGSRQYEYYFSGELTASHLSLDAVRIQNLYIVF